MINQYIPEQGLWCSFCAGPRHPQRLGCVFFNPPISLGTHAKLAQLYGFLHSVDLQSGRAG